MTICISGVFSIFLISTFILSGETHGNSFLQEQSSLSHYNSSEIKLKFPQSQFGFEEYGNSEPPILLNRSYNEVRKGRSKKKRQSAHRTKTTRHAKNLPYSKSPSIQSKPNNNLHSSDDKDVKVFETYEEIHEHINEPDDQDTQYQESKQYESHEEVVSATQSTEAKKQDTPVKIKVKHHHHHHHHNHIKEVIKTVPKPYAVEKIVHIPIEKIVEKIVQVPKIVNVTVEKIIHVPVEKIIEKVVRIPKPVHVPKPYVIEKIMEKIIHVPKPYPVLKTVPYPVEIKVPVTVEKKIPIPFKVEVERKVPVYIKSNEPYKYEQAQYKNIDEKDMAKFASNYEETSNHPIYFSENYNYNSKLSPSKPEIPRHPKYPTIIEEIPRHPQYPPMNEAMYHHTNPHNSQHSSPMEQSTAESTFLPIKFVESKSPFNIFVPHNDTSFDVNAQTFGNKIQELPYSFPIEFIQMQPMPFQNALRPESSFQQPTTKN